ncbi:MAG TPA: ribonuclease E/G, partial [Clostridiales bacterium]|nr:ribonuclease E/G [Clostridiales bacterium]
MSNKLVIVKKDKHIISSFFETMNLVQVSIDQDENNGILGNIYLGKVKNIVKNINAAFIEIEGGRMCYYSLKENPYPIMANTPYTDDNGLVKTDIKAGDELLVQVVKEDVKTKAPVVSSNLNLTGKYVALTYGKSLVGVSAKINDDKERSKLKKIGHEYRNKEFGFIIRTNAAYAPEDKIRKEIELLIETYKSIRQYGIHKNVFSRIYQTPPSYICDIRDGYTQKVDEFVTDNKGLYEHIKDYLTKYQPEDLSKLRFYEDSLLSLTNLYGLKDKIESATKPYVWLKSGGTLVIQPTEALTVIDVN